MTLDPRVLILDEPTSMLDVSIQAHVMNILKDLQKEKNMTYLFISHDLEVLHWFCDEICVMKEGEIVERGGRDEIVKTPKHPFTRELVESFCSFYEEGENDDTGNRFCGPLEGGIKKSGGNVQSSHDG